MDQYYFNSLMSKKECEKNMSYTVDQINLSRMLGLHILSGSKCSFVVSQEKKSINNP